MAAKKDISKPLFLNLDSSFQQLKENEAAYIRDITWDINSNKNLRTGSGSASEEGQNLLILTPVKSNMPLTGITLPSGYNKSIGTFESVTTQELYHLNYNGNGNHGVYVINGNDLSWKSVIIDSQLNFSDDQDAFVTEHRIRLRAIKNESGDIIEKILMFTNGKNWQYWINVNAAINTNGFDASAYPYWNLQPPHFDRRELFEYAFRPPMSCPSVVAIANTNADLGNINYLIDSAFEFCIQYIYTDGRETTVSPYSLPFAVKTEDYLSNPDSITKKLLLTFVAGSCMVEKINLYYRFVNKSPSNDASTFESWGDWFLYDTIYKYGNTVTNTTAVLGTKYWLRTNPWASNSYDPVQNTIQYVFDNSKLGQITPQDLFQRVQTSLSQLSRTMSDLGDSILMSNNRNGYDNFSDKVTSQLSASYDFSTNQNCQIPTRKVRLYAYIGNEGEDGFYLSQVGYYEGADTQMRFGGMTYAPGSTQVSVNLNESKYFALDFSDRNAFRCYLKGTQYFSDGVWYQVNNDNSLVELTTLLDFSNTDVLTYAKNVFLAGGYFVCVFDFEVPAGRYLATLGRHNVASSGDYVNTSTYIEGLANSRVKTNFLPNAVSIMPNSALVSFSKEMQIDCTANDVDVWGNGQDLFYVYCPHIATGSIAQYRFIEGYLKEQPSRPLGMELFPYTMSSTTPDDYGRVTDKNGFYFAYTKRADSGTENIQFNFVMNCIPNQTFIIPTAGGIGWRVNSVVYLSDHNNGQIGYANYVVLNIHITDITGNIGYSNISASIQDGSTVVTDSNGNAQLIIHNGINSNRTSNVYINASGDFVVSLQDCGYLNTFLYGQSNVVCNQNAEQIYPLPVNIGVRVNGGTQLSLKSISNYIVSVVGADLAGRVTFINKFASVNIPSFDQMNSVSATHLTWLLANGGLQLNSDPKTNDIAWLAFYVSRSTNYQRYIQWVGDKIEYIDSNGNVTNSPSNCVFARITITSLLQNNLNNNLNLFSNYEFSKGDRIRIFDDGNGHLFDTATYGDIIDVEIQGTNYNQAAINVNLLTPATNTVLNPNQTIGTTAVTLYVRYDSKFQKLQNDTGFWIELYTPSQNNQILPFYEVESFFPVINGEIAVYEGGGVGNPEYTYPTSGILNYWDTYYIRRSINITNAGNKFFNHPFESPNITDTWGANIISGGRQNTINPEALQLWYEDETRRSDVFISSGSKNGLGTFRSENIKSFKGYQRGGIVAVACQYSVILFLCENDWFIVDYNFNYIFANAQGVQIANLSDNMGEPHQKIGNNFGCSYQDTQSIIVNDNFVSWYDRKNTGYILCNYRTAVDITKIKEDKTGMVQSYFQAKSQFITNWNEGVTNQDLFDVVSGIDLALKNIYVTFRPRRGNTNNKLSYVNNRRNVSIDFQETLVYSITTERWIRFSGATPEAYGKLRGNTIGKQIIMFAAGIPYIKDDTTDAIYSNMFGVQLQPCFIISIAKEGDLNKTLKCIYEDVSDTVMYIDSVVGNDFNSFSFVPVNYFKKREKNYYAPFARNMMTYPPVDPKLIYQNMLLSGKRIWGNYFILRFVSDFNDAGKYFELNEAEVSFFDNEPENR